MKIIKLLLFVLVCTAFAPNANTATSSSKSSMSANNKVSKEQSLYQSLQSGNFKVPNFDVFATAFKGFEVLQQQGKLQHNLLTIVDFSLSSTQKRMWIIDMNTKKILCNTLVAHGQNTGLEFAKDFSNTNESHKSSLGFFVTAETYFGSHGLSLKLDGQEKGINDNARKRAIVIHGADYVSDSFIANNQRLGRSYGCPAIPVSKTKEIITLIKDKSCLFLYYPSNDYLEKSKLIS